MGFLFYMVLLTCLFLYTRYAQVLGDKLLWNEDLDLETQVKLLNKPPIRVFQDEAGGLFDCIDILTQPAFHHPLLKNHKIEMRPTSLPKQSHMRAKPPYRQTMSGPKDIGFRCPKGTVPIRRVTKDDLINAKLLSESNIKNINSITDPEPGAHVAVVRSIKTTLYTYNGVEAHFNMLNPKVGPNEWSSGQMWIENGPSDDLNTIQSGWTVSPQLYKDNYTHSFLYWKGEGNKGGCYNLICSGFVQVDSKYPIGRVVPTSDYGEQPIEYPLSIYQDQKSKNWWLVNTEMPIHYGYWPKALFPHLENGTSFVAWGGLTKGTKNQISPPMGSGYFSDGDYTHTGYFADMKVVLATDYLKYDPDKLFMEEFTDVSKCYNAINYGIQKVNHSYVIMYGGPGGNCGK